MNQPLTLKQMLDRARAARIAVGSFAPRYTPAIEPVLRAGQQTNSPLIVQISQNEFGWYSVTAAEFAAEFYAQMERQHIEVPVTLHLDHTRDMAVIEAAIEAGFTSVMIDASDKPLEENIAITRRVVDYAHEHHVSVEAELGRIGRADDENVETDNDEELYTNPAEARRFVIETGVDALAISVGTVHGVYKVKQARIDFARLQAIRAATEVPLVLHGGSGLAPDVIQRAIRLEGGGVSKINIATDLELTFLAALGREKRMLNADCKALPPAQLVPALAAVEQTVRDKIVHFLQTNDCASQF
jgi:fructose-bisphosphate aldolase class II